MSWSQFSVLQVSYLRVFLRCFKVKAFHLFFPTSLPVWSYHILCSSASWAVPSFASVARYCRSKHSTCLHPHILPSSDSAFGSSSRFDSYTGAICDDDFHSAALHARYGACGFHNSASQTAQTGVGVPLPEKYSSGTYFFRIAPPMLSDDIRPLRTACDTMRGQARATGKF